MAVQIDWQVWCFPGDDVPFGIASVAQPASGGNIFIRIRLRLFGRREQLRFRRMTAAPMAKLSARALEPA